MGVEFRYSLSRHPQSNGQVEATNKILMGMLKKWLNDRKGAWAEELPAILWAYRVIVKTQIGEAPFTLTYGHKVMPPVEIRISTYRVQHFEQESNDRWLEE